MAFVDPGTEARAAPAAGTAEMGRADELPPGIAETGRAEPATVPAVGAEGEAEPETGAAETGLSAPDAGVTSTGLAEPTGGVTEAGLAEPFGGVTEV